MKQFKFVLEHDRNYNYNSYQATIFPVSARITNAGPDSCPEHVCTPNIFILARNGCDSSENIATAPVLTEDSRV